MGKRNYLVEGVSGAGKTSVAEELERRGFHVVHGDQVRALVSDHSDRLSFFCGGSRNSAMFVDLFDGVFVLEVDRETLNRRLDVRPADEFGRAPEERALVLRVHLTREDLPVGAVSVDATRPIDEVVDEILRHVEEDASAAGAAG